MVEHRDGKLARIDPDTNEVMDEITIAEGGDNPVCGLCVENVIFAHDSIWTSNNWGRSVSHIDPHSLEVTVIPTQHEVWAVTATNDAIWASQKESVDEVLDNSQSGVVRIDPETLEVQQMEAPGVISVSGFGDRLFLVVWGRRSDLLYGYRVE